jgi:PRC-barrel domain
VASSTLPGLTTGLTVQNGSGTNIGTVSSVVTDRNGNIRLVVVTDTSTGQTFRLAPNTLSISGSGMVTTTSTVGG